MATTVGSHSVSAFATPVNGGPLDANVVRGNDNTIRTAYVSHDADTGIHVQSSSLASRPTAGTAGRKWITVDTGSYKLWYDDGTTWHEVGTATIDVYVIADENLVKGDVVKVTGYNNGAGAPRVAKVASASDVAFGIINQTIANGATGYLTNTGIIADVATNTFNVGDILYPNTSGGFTATKPTSGNYQPAGYVLRSNANNGVLYVEFSAPRIVERSDNTASTIVLRDASGNFAAGTITAGALTASGAVSAGSVTSTGLVTFASLKGTGATTVTNILDEDNMASDSATALATQQSIKAYVDAKVATVDTLAEVLANGNTTGAHDIIVTAGQKVTTDTIAETTSGSGVTIDSVLLKDDVVNATDIETGTVSANDGTLAITVANSTGALTLATALADSNLATISTAGKVSNSATTATATNTNSAIVARDGSGNFSAGTITANLTGNISGTAPAGTLTGTTLASNVVSSSLTSVGTLANLTVTNPITGSVTGSSGSTTGNAATATALQTARNINGVSFNGTADITVTAAAGTLSGSTLASGVTASSLTSVGTLSSLTVSGDLTVDTNTLYVDSANNRVGVRTTSPQVAFQVSNNGASAHAVRLYDTGANASYLALTASNTDTALIASGTSAVPMDFYTGGSARMRIDASGNLAVDTNTLYVDATNNRVGIGTASPAYTFEAVSGTGSLILGAFRTGDSTAANNAGGGFVGTSSATAGSRSARMWLDADGANFSGSDYFYIDKVGNSGIVELIQVSNAAMTFHTNNTEKMRLDASGNLGLGVTPSAWAGAGRIMQFGNGSASIGTQNSGDANFMSNAYESSAGSWTRVTNGSGALRYQLDINNNVHKWYTAAVGSGAITWGDAKMTLDASGNWSLGTTSVFGSAANRIVASINGATDALYAIGIGGTQTAFFYSSATQTNFGTKTNIPLTLHTNDAERARITSGGTLLVAKTADDDTTAGFRYNATSYYLTLVRDGNPTLVLNRLSSDGGIQEFWRSGTAVGSISVTTTATAYNTSSDRRLKENIEPAEDAGDIIDAIQIVQYDWKVGGHTRFGIVAQDEVENVPEAINVGDDGEDITQMWGVDYSKLVPMLVKEIQSLRARVAVLEA